MQNFLIFKFYWECHMTPDLVFPLNLDFRISNQLSKVTITVNLKMSLQCCYFIMKNFQYVTEFFISSFCLYDFHEFVSNKIISKYFGCIFLVANMRHTRIIIINNCPQQIWYCLSYYFPPTSLGYHLSINYHGAKMHHHHSWQELCKFS